MEIQREKTSVLLMDEPSSSLDPRSQREMYDRMVKNSDEKTVIFITHQLYSTKLADRIYYFDHGSIIESGTHEELIRLDGKYAALYRIQAEQYAFSAEE